MKNFKYGFHCPICENLMDIERYQNMGGQDDFKEITIRCGECGYSNSTTRFPFLKKNQSVLCDTFNTTIRFTPYFSSTYIGSSINIARKYNYKIIQRKYHGTNQPNRKITKTNFYNYKDKSIIHSKELKELMDNIKKEWRFYFNAFS